MSDFDITIFRGDTPTLEFTFLDGETSQPLNLSGWTLYFAVKHSDGTLLINKLMTVTDPTNGTAQVALTASETNAVGIHIAEIESRKDADILTLVQGLLRIRNDVRP
ncbi:MAG: BppU family phage baseplate upper protein [Armatimonadetes bacterium]|nr:BppU family phage baseplate upper protein [Armatimonadota bacterium]MDW8122708.1 BppU family phage baseplate upper protein [Armatimonadota bacterium]